jgi:TP901 family phage tail tape measure protein
MADVNANIGVNIDTSAALAQLKSLQRQISQFHTSISKSSESAAIAQKSLQKNLLNSVNSIGAFSAELRTVKTSAESFTASLEGNKFSMREYFRYAGASTRTFGRLFKSEFDTIGKVAEERVKRLQTQYIKLGRDTNGAMQALAVTPTSLNMNDYATRTAMAAQKQALFNQLMKQGSTNLLNFGKNTQWAGRQLMVGFTIPLSIVGAAATKTFMEMEAQALKFKKVYGDLFTPQQETQDALDNITELGKLFTKYGIAVSQTVGLASEAAAAGFQGLDLQRQTTEATRLSVLGQIDSQKALETTIALQNAFGMSSENLAGSIDFLNAVENQTVVSLDDITTAIPKVAPVIQQLGGDVKDLTFFIAAMKEGGINASEGANALKSGLAALINPTGRANEMLKSFGINANEIVTKNKGNLKATVIEFATALNQLDPLNRAQAIEQMFGKFQFARLSTLFANVAKDGNQAARVLDLANSSVEDLASLSEKELGMTAESSMNKFKKTVEDLKLALIPVGQAFLEAVTPILEFVGNILEKFGNLSAGTKKVVTLITLGIAGLAPIFLMTFGLLANLLANAVKGAMILRNGYLRLTGQSQVLGEQTQYLTMEQIEAAAAAHSLDQSHARLTQQFTAEASAVAQLIAAYQQATVAGQKFMLNNPGMMNPGVRRGYASGVVSVPGSGKGDTVPAMLTPGEAVIPADMAKKYAPLISGMIAGNIPGYQDGLERSSASGMVFAHGIAPVNLSADAIKQLSLSVSQSLRRSLSEATRVTGFTNMGFLAPQNLNKGKMSGEEGGQFFKQNAELATSRIYKSITDLLPAAASDPNVKKDVILFGQNIGEQLTLAGSKSVSDPDFYNAVSNALEKTMTQATTQAFKESMPKIQKQITAIGAFGGEANRGERGQRASLSKLSQQRAFGYEQGMVSYKGQTLKSQLAKQGFDQGNQLAMSAVAGAQQGAATSSPSKKTIKIGQDIARGLEVGMADRQDDVARAGSSLSTAAVGGTQSGRNRPGRSPRTPQVSGIRLNTVAANMPMSPQIQQAVVTQARVTQTATQRMQKLDRSLMGASFAVSSLAGIASMSGGKLGEMSGTISKVTGALFALQAVTALLTQNNLLQLATSRGAKSGLLVQNAATNKMGLNTTLFSGGIKKLLPNLLNFGKIIVRFLGPIGIAIGVITAGVSIIKMVNAARERERLAIYGLSEAMKTTTSQVKTLGDFFGVVPSKLPFDIGNREIVGSKTRTKREALKDNTEFQKEFKQTIESLRTATNEEAKLVFSGLALNLQAQGFAKDQVQVIVDALREESAQTDVVFDLKSLDLSAKSLNALKNTVAPILVTLNQALESGMETRFIRGYGDAVSETYIELNKEARKQLETTATFLSEAAKSASGMFELGLIKAKDYEATLETLIGSTKGLDAAQRKLLLTKVFESLGKGAGKLVTGLKSAKQEIMALALLSSGMLDTEGSLYKALTSPDDRTRGRGVRRLTEQYNLLTTAITAANAAEKKKKFVTPGEDGKEKDGPLAIAQDFIALQEQLIDMQNAPKLKKYNDELERQEGLLKGINKNIDAITEAQIAPLEARLKTNGYLIDEIANKEDAINEKYNLQIEALSQVQKINEEIASSEKERLSLADALSRGDIAAAAVIAQEARARAASSATGRAESSLTASRDSEIKALGRNQLEKENKQIQLDINKIQRDQLDPLNNQKTAIEKNITAQNDLKSALEKSIDIRKSEIKYLGMTKTEIDEAAKALDLAQNPNVDIKSKSFLTNIIKGALGDAEALKKALQEVATESKNAFNNPASKKIANIVTQQEEKKQAISEGLALMKEADMIRAMNTGYLSMGGLVPKYFANGGLSKGTDTVPAMLTPGEFVMRKSAVDKFGPLLSAINDPSFKMPKSSSYNGASSGVNNVVDNSSAMYNYNIGITVPQSNANPNDIANAVIGQIKYIDAQRIRGQR